MITVKDFLLSLPKVSNHQESFDVFKQIDKHLQEINHFLKDIYEILEEVLISIHQSAIVAARSKMAASVARR